MAAVTAPSRGGSLLGIVARALSARAGAKGKASRVAAVIADHAGTMAALGFADVAMWHLGPFWGWMGTAVAVLIGELKIRGG